MDADFDSTLPEHFPLIDSIDHDILMHRDAHFGGKFSIMLDYYSQNGKGVQPEFDFARIERLANLEEQLKQNLAALFLESSEMQKIGDSRKVYLKLREIYEIKNPKTIFPQLIADLILSEEEEPKNEIANIVKEKGAIVPFLIDLIRDEQMYDPLFPGYGLAPAAAVECLGQIGDKRAIISLFEAIGQSDFFGDEQIILALKSIGNPAKDFLMHVVKGRPLNEDNEKGAIALLAFKDDEDVANFCFDLFQDPEVQKDLCLTTYLVLICEGLKDSVRREQFKQMSQNSKLSSMLRKDMETIIHSW